MSRLPFLRPGAPDDVIAWRQGAPVTRAQFRQDVAQLTRRLPDRSAVLNHCEDRYRFLVGLVAALNRRQLSLFPPNRASETLAVLKREYPDVYCLTDESKPAEADIMEVLAYDTAGSGPVSVDDPAFAPEQLAVAMFTSGSTGVPKRHTKTWGSLVTESRLAGQALGLNATAGGQVLATVPAQHMYGLTFSVIVPAQWGYVIGAERPFYPEDIRRVLATSPRPVVLITTPLHIRACVLDGVEFPPLDFILSSTAPLEAALAAQAEARFTTTVREIYGSTETGAIATRRQAQGAVWRTFEGVTVSALDEGFRVMAPYLEAPQTMGDSIEIHDPGRFTLLGRNAEIVKIAGKRVALGDLNRHLLAIEGVRDGTFFLPDPEPGREARLTAFVVAPGRTREQILDALRQRIDAVFLPRPLRLVERLPRNATGKLPRQQLTALVREAEAREAAG
jgi:acyl-coenzyme A synthetase/AMP-(fatty) acid ligase